MFHPRTTGAGEGSTRSSSQGDDFGAFSSADTRGALPPPSKSSPSCDHNEPILILDETRQRTMFEQLFGAGGDELHLYREFVVDKGRRRVVAGLREQATSKGSFLNQFPDYLRGEGIDPNPDPLAYCIVDNPYFHGLPRHG